MQDPGGEDVPIIATGVKARQGSPRVAERGQFGRAVAEDAQLSASRRWRSAAASASSGASGVPATPARAGARSATPGNGPPAWPVTPPNPCLHSPVRAEAWLPSPPTSCTRTARPATSPCADRRRQASVIAPCAGPRLRPLTWSAVDQRQRARPRSRPPRAGRLAPHRAAAVGRSTSLSSSHPGLRPAAAASLPRRPRVQRIDLRLCGGSPVLRLSKRLGARAARRRPRGGPVPPGRVAWTPRLRRCELRDRRIGQESPFLSRRSIRGHGDSRTTAAQHHIRHP